jgi:hypothetical protein
VEILLSLVCLVPMLEILNALVKFAQLKWYFCLWFCGSSEDVLKWFEQTLCWSCSSFHW